jgi:hypothetical protein
MKIVEIAWLQEVEEKCVRKHRVMPHEVEEVFRGNARFNFVEKGFRRGEDLYVARGRTKSGRYLMVYFIEKKDGSALVLSARPMTQRERRSYEQKHGSH